MGGRAQVLVVGASELAGWAEARIEDLERQWSRFVGMSDVSIANGAAGTPVPVGPDTVLLAKTALLAQEETGGAYDPLLGEDIAHLGYDRTFDAIDYGASPAPAPRRPKGSLLVSDDEATITVPVGRAFDPGGIGKGLAADMVVDGLADRGADGALVNIGGDVRVWGTSPTVEGWVISVEHPLVANAELVRVVLADGAVASSSRLRRRWGPAEAPVHHLLDPESGRPVDNGVAAVTVFADTGRRAEAFAKAAFLAGCEGGIDVLEANGLDGMVAGNDGRVRSTRNMSVIAV